MKTKQRLRVSWVVFVLTVLVFAFLLFGILVRIYDPFADPRFREYHKKESSLPIRVSAKGEIIGRDRDARETYYAIEGVSPDQAVIVRRGYGFPGACDNFLCLAPDIDDPRTVLAPVKAKLLLTVDAAGATDTGEMVFIIEDSATLDRIWQAFTVATSERINADDVVKNETYEIKGELTLYLDPEEQLCVTLTLCDTQRYINDAHGWFFAARYDVFYFGTHYEYGIRAEWLIDAYIGEIVGNWSGGEAS